MNNTLQAIELDACNPNSFGDFIRIIQSASRSNITLYQYEIQYPSSDKQKHLALYIVAYMDSHPSKRILVNNGSTINIISLVALERLKVPIQLLNAPTLAIIPFNNTLTMTIGIIILPIRFGVTEISMTCHVVKGEMQYNLLLGWPWIEDMESILSTLHWCLKYLHNVTIHYIIGDPNPFRHCNLSFSHESSQIPCGHILHVTILMNHHPK